MFEFGKRAACFAVAGTLALGGLAGCGAQQQGSSAASSSTAPEPTTAMEVYERYEANPNQKNVHSNMTYNMALAIMGQTLEVTGTSESDMVGDAMHSTTKAQAMGQDTTTETYVEKTSDGKYVTYSSSTEEGKTTWTKLTTETGGLENQLIEKDMFKDAKFEKSDNGYKITVAGKEFSTALSSLGINNYAQMMGDEQALLYAFDNSDAVFTFDKDCMLTNLTFALNVDLGAAAGASSSSATNSSSTTTEEGAAVGATMKLDLKVDYTDYGNVDASKVAIPEDVKKNAVDGGEISLSDVAGEATTTEETAASSSSSAA